MRNFAAMSVCLAIPFVVGACNGEPESESEVLDIELRSINLLSLPDGAPAVDVWVAGLDGFSSVEDNLVEGEMSHPDMVQVIDGSLRVRILETGSGRDAPPILEESFASDGDPHALILHPMLESGETVAAATYVDLKTADSEPDNPDEVRLHLFMAGTVVPLDATGYRLGTRTDLADPRDCYGPFEPTAESYIDVAPGGYWITVHAADDAACESVLGASLVLTVEAGQAWLLLGWGATESAVSMRALAM